MFISRHPHKKSRVVESANLGVARGVGGRNHARIATCVPLRPTRRGGVGDSVVVVLCRSNGLAAIGRAGNGDDDAALGWLGA